MKIHDIINCLVHSKLDLSKVWVLCGAATVLHGLKEEAADIDIGCSV